MGEALAKAAAAVHMGDGESALAALDRGFPEGGARPIGWRICHEFLRALALVETARGEVARAAQARLDRF
jgi:hypothetical protein